MIYRPENVLFLGIGTYLAVFLLSPVEVLVQIEAGSLIYITLTIMALILGSRFADNIRIVSALVPVPIASLERGERRLFWVMVLLGTLGIIVKMYDTFVVRGVGSLVGLGAREALIDSGGGALSVIGGILYPFGYLPIFILLGSKAMHRSRGKLLLAGVLFFMPALFALLLSSRSFMLVALAMGYFGVSLTIFRGRAMPLKIALPALAAFLLAVTVSVTVFQWRLDEMQLDLADSAHLSAYSATVGPNTLGRELVMNGGFMAGVVPMAQYYVHSMFEFQLLWEWQSNQVFAHGALMFNPYMKLLSILGLAPALNLYELFPRVGVFTSFWGPFWVDFGWAGPLVMFFFGLLLRVAARSAAQGGLHVLPFYAYSCVILFFMPVVNFAVSAQGMYVINAFLVFFFLSRGVARAMPV